MAELTEKPLQTQKTNFVLKTGTAEIKLVITVAPHRDIWPQGKTYPKKATPIKRRRIVTPLNHAFSIRKGWLYNPRDIWRYAIKKTESHLNGANVTKHR